LGSSNALSRVPHLQVIRANIEAMAFHLPVVLAFAMTGTHVSSLPISLVASQSQKTMIFNSTELVLGSSYQIAVQMLIADIFVGTKTTKKVFMSKCLEHVEDLVAALDKGYTDVQLQTVLTHECMKADEFPKSSSVGFKSAATCENFAEKLMSARMYFLETGNKTLYVEFCADYWALKAPKELLEKEKSAAATKGLVAFVATAMLALLH